MKNNTHGLLVFSSTSLLTEQYKKQETPRRGWGQSSEDQGNRRAGIPPQILAHNRLQHIKEQRRNTCGELSGDDLKELDIESIVWGAGLNFPKQWKASLIPLYHSDQVPTVPMHLFFQYGLSTDGCFGNWRLDASGRRSIDVCVSRGKVGAVE